MPNDVRNGTKHFVFEQNVITIENGERKSNKHSSGEHRIAFGPFGAVKGPFFGRNIVELAAIIEKFLVRCSDAS